METGHGRRLSQAKGASDDQHTGEAYYPDPADPADDSELPSRARPLPGDRSLVTPPPGLVPDPPFAVAARHPERLLLRRRLCWPLGPTARPVVPRFRVHPDPFHHSLLT